ncbi:RNA ligase [Thermosulfuriphilus sp.]
MDTQKDQEGLLKLLRDCLPQPRRTEDLQKALEEGRIEFCSGLRDGGFRIKKGLWGLEVGTVLTRQGLISAYPRIPRIFVLEKGLARNFKGNFYAEEKIEGYNVRFAKAGSQIVGFTRRGYICPFASDRWSDFLDLEAFFAKHPRLVLCCEVAGPETPFLTEWPPYIREDVRFFVFDFLELDTGRLLPPEEKYQLIRNFCFPSPEIHGPFAPSDWKRITKIIKKYDQEGREGLVFKEVSGQKAFKFVTPRSNLNDLRVSIALAGDLHPAYYLHRVIRLALACFEEGRPLEEKLTKDLGQALILPLIEALEKISQGQRIEETFKVRLKTEESFRALLRHFEKTRVKINILEKGWKEGYLVVRFSKEYLKSTDFWRSKLSGAPEVD